MHLEIRLLENFEVRLDGELTTGFDAVKVRALLAYLVSEPERPQGRHKLAGLLWPDYPEPSANKSLRQALYSLRKTLNDPPCIEADRQSITFVPGESCTTDILELEWALNEARTNPQAIPRLFSTVELDRGPFLEGFLLNDSPEFEAWILNRREHHNRQLLEALSILADYHEHKGEWSEAELFARRQLEIELWREEAHRQLMRIMASQGKPDQAIMQYEKLVVILKNELGGIPSEKTTRLVESIRSGEQIPYGTQASEVRRSGVSAKPQHNLPVQRTSFIGRNKDIALIQAALSRHRLVTIIGHGGIGKTRTAIQVALAAQDAFPDGAWMVDLASVSDPDRVLQTAARAIGMHLDTGSEALDTFLNYTDQRQLLLLLDNCEHLVDACAQLCREILTHCPQVKILATSREILDISGEAVHNLPALSFPDSNEIPDFDLSTQFEAVELFTTRASAVNSHFTVNSTNVSAVSQLCAQLDGIPLAIELAAAWTRTLPVDQINRRLSSSLDFLRGPGRETLPRHQTMRACLDWSYNLLTSQEQRLLQALSVFAGGWTLEAAEAVCAEECDSPHEILETIDQLVAKSLVIYERDPEIETRYRLLEPVRQYAQEKLRQSGDPDAAQDHLLIYYKDLAAQAKPHLRAHRQIEWIRRLERELPNIRQAVNWACSQDGPVGRLEAGLRMMADLHYFWQLRHRHLEAIQGLERLLILEKSLREDQTMPESLCLARADAIYVLLEINNWNGGGTFQVESYFEECQQLYRQLGQAGRKGILYTLFMQSNPLPLNQQLTRMEEICADAEEIGDKFLVTECLYVMGDLKRHSGNMQAAEDLYQESIKLTLEIGDYAKIPVLSIRLGETAFEQGDLGMARKYIHDARKKLKEIETDLVQSAFAAYFVICDLVWWMGDYDQAIQDQQFMDSAARKFDQPLLSNMFVLVGIYLSQGDTAKVADILDEIQKLTSKNKLGVDLRLNLISALYAYEVGDLAQATMYFKSVLQDEDDWTLVRYMGLTGLAFIAFAESDITTMSAYLKSAIQYQLQNPFSMLAIEDSFTRVRLTGVLGASQKLFYEAGRLFGAADRQYQLKCKTFPLSRRKLFEQTIADIRAALDEKTYAAAWGKGKEMDLNQALQYALEVINDIQAEPVNNQIKNRLP